MFFNGISNKYNIDNYDISLHSSMPSNQSPWIRFPDDA